jgi:hypothetical protein
MVGTFFKTLFIFLLFHIFFWCTMAYNLNKTFCLEETVFRSEFFQIYGYAGFTFLTVTLLGVALNRFFCLPEYKSSTITPSVDIASTPILLETKKMSTDSSIPIPSVIEIVPAENLFKYVRYEIDYNTISKVPVRVLTNLVEKDKLLLILQKVEKARLIINRYTSQHIRAGEDPELDAVRIYRRFQRYKEEVPSFSHEKRFGDWFDASSVLDEFQQTLTLLMLALIEKPIEWIDDNKEAAWDYEIWQNYMFKCHKNFDSATDVLNYAEQLIQTYLHKPEKFSQINPVWVNFPENGPRLKIIYLWEEMVKVERSKKLAKESNLVIDMEVESLEKTSPLQSPIIQSPTLNVDTNALDSSNPNVLFSVLQSLKAYFLYYFY